MAAPPDDVVHHVHDRYLKEVVEGLGLCPFARHSREQGRVHRPLFHVDEHTPEPKDVAQQVLELVRTHADVEIVLPTFVDPRGRFETPSAFETFTTSVREAYDALDGPVFFMVAFHPRLSETVDRERPLTKDSLVPLIRRTPDPVIQCVNGIVLEKARVAAQQAARRKLLEAHADDPVLRAMIERSVQTDSELSADIARANFTACGTGEGFAKLEGTIAEIKAERDAAYRGATLEPPCDKPDSVS